MEKPSTKNIILNHEFSGGLHWWRPNGGNAFVFPTIQSAKLSGRYAVVTDRKECWHGLEQDITDRVSAGTTYTVCAWVAISGEAVQGVIANVQATLKLENPNSSPTYLFVGISSASTERWEKVEGTFGLSTVPHRVTFYLEGPAPGIDLLIKSVVISPTSFTECDGRSSGSSSNGDESVIVQTAAPPAIENAAFGLNIVVNGNLGDITNKFNSVSITINHSNCNKCKNEEDGEGNMK